ncbi:MAG: hypothetical protein HKP41_08510 [Desulfobacterales bacterium]|nr:hypothetical protein [Desulfobacterales bacterium]
MYSLLRYLAGAVSLLLFIPSISIASTQDSSSGLIFEKTKGWQLPYKPIDVVQSVDGQFIFVLTENNRVLIYEPNGNLKGSIPVENGITAIETDARGENIYLIDQEKNNFSSISIDFVVDINTDGSPFQGKPNAPVTIAVFTDFE